MTLRGELSENADEDVIMHVTHKQKANNVLWSICTSICSKNPHST